MKSFSTTPIVIAAFLTTPFSYLSMPKLNINGTDNNCFKFGQSGNKVDIPHTEKIFFMTDCGPFLVAIW